MTPEEYKRIKEAEKEHLRSLKKLKEQLRNVQRQGKVAEAMNEIQKAPGDEIASTHDEMIERLAMDTIQGEARLEIALEESARKDAEAAMDDVSAETEAEASKAIAQSDAELKKLRAQELVRQIKLQMGLADVKRKHEKSGDAGAKHSSSEQGQEEPVDTGKEQEKTVDSAPEGKLPEKTIGRIPRKKP